MKRFLLILVPVIILLMMATPILAAPGDTGVDVSVSTPGDVDLDVDINAGGDVTAIVDGVDLQEYASQTAVAYRFATKTHYGERDWIFYWTKSGLGPYVEGNISELQKAVGLALETNAKLITVVEAEAMDIGSLQARDDVIWDQLMNGAEYHIALLDEDVVSLTSEVANLQAQAAYLQGQLDIAAQNETALRDYTSAQVERFTYYVWVLGGCLVLAFLLTCVVIRKVRR